MAHLSSIHHARKLLKEGHSVAAEEVAQEVHRAQPRNVDAIALLIEIANTRGDHDAIERLARSALAVKPKDLYFTSVIAENFFQQGDSRRAIDACHHALATFPKAEVLLRIKALSHEVVQEFGEAWSCIDPLLQDGSASSDAVTIAGRILHGLQRFDEAIRMTRPIAEDTGQPAQTRQRIWFQLAKTYDRIGDYDQAIAASSSAHALSHVRFSPVEFEASVNEMLETFDRSNLRSLARASNRSELPVFIIGMPRSGTTLLEQIIHSHPGGFGAGELQEIETISRSVQVATDSFHEFPHNLVDMNPDIAERFAAQYLSRLKALGGNALRIVNKVLDQYWLVGFIWMILPGARIIHIRRDPLDTCLSCYTRHLNPNRMPYARNLEHLGLVYRQHERLMDHWKNTLDLRIMTVQYEELVADQERVTRQVIDFLGLSWNDRCLRYWENDRTAMTLSYDQVNKPMYDSSIGRWKHYAKHLAPLQRALGLESSAE